jgi:DNA-binding response OmpR family regulator
MKQRVLVVEDNPLNSELLCDWLDIRGYEVLTAADLDAAFTAVKNERPDIVLLDVQLGPDDGMLLASWMRKQEDFCRIPIIAVTAQAMVSERQHILESGCNEIVSKPIDFNLLESRLEQWLGQRPSLQANGAAGRT